MKELICIVCPMGCHLEVDDENNYGVTGNKCKRGIIYGKKELTNPTRTITSTVKIANGIYPRLPVKTDTDIPKAFMMEIMKELDKITVEAPIKKGAIIIENILNTNANIVATRSM